MRKTLFMLVVLLALVVVTAGLAAAATSECKKHRSYGACYGTDEADNITGDYQPNAISMARVAQM